jgi:hypothetical protein
MGNTGGEAGKVKQRKAILQFTYNLQNLRGLLPVNSRKNVIRFC